MHFLDGICKENIKILRCDVHIRDVHGSWRQASKTCTQWSHNLFRIYVHRKSIYASDFSRQIPTSFAHTPEVDLRTWFFSSNHNKSRSAFISWDNFNVRFVWRIRIMSSKNVVIIVAFSKRFWPHCVVHLLRMTSVNAELVWYLSTYRQPLLKKTLLPLTDVTISQRNAQEISRL